jgi:hypothetical protein
MSHHGGIAFNDIFREVVDGSMACVEDLLNPNFYETSHELGLLITCLIFEMSFSDILRSEWIAGHLSKFSASFWHPTAHLIRLDSF